MLPPIVETLRLHTSSLPVKGFARFRECPADEFPMLFDVLAFCYPRRGERCRPSHTQGMLPPIVETLRLHTSSLPVKGFARFRECPADEFPMLFDVLAFCYHMVTVANRPHGP